MPSNVDSRRGRIALMVAHCAGMVDLIALPLWVGALISHYRFDPQQAGGLATLFLLGVVVASVGLAPRFARLNGRRVAAVGFAVGAAGFAAAFKVTDYATLAALHAGSGLGIGAALSVTHGTIARSAQPHRLFALVGIALGFFAVVFLAATPQVMAATGAPTLFAVFAGVMLLAAAVAVLAFPAAPAPRQGAETGPAGHALPPLDKAVWFGIAGIVCMTVVQAMTFSFLERAGSARGFERQAINAALVPIGLVNLFPAALAALLERHWPARGVLLVAPLVQAAITATIMNASGYPVFAVAVAVFASVIIFAHTFAFGLLARLDPTGRAMAATPAMLMAGSAIGPVLGGTLVKSLGYGSLGVAAGLMAVVAVACFSRLPSSASRSAAHPAAA
jgi:predicted MFS family arabinose efflux permease